MKKYDKPTPTPLGVIARTKRAEILILLLEHEIKASDIEHELGLPHPTASRHLKALAGVGLIESRHLGRFHLYRLSFQGRILAVALNDLIRYNHENTREK